MVLPLHFPALTTIFRPLSPPSSTNFLPLSYSIKPFKCSATAVTSPKQRNESELENKKYDVLKAIQDTQRGLVTTPNQRSEIEECLVDLESYEADIKAIDLEKLDGTWRLSYTSASDVLVLLDSSARFPFFQRNESELENKKYDVLKAIQDTQRGLVTTPNQRSEIEECLVDLESYEADIKAIDLEKLDGTWRLSYTSASDVLVLLDSSARFPFFQVGQIFQKFECKGQTDGGYIRNVVRWSIPSLLENIGDVVRWCHNSRVHEM
ncbi:Plastid lipid-associated protein/fibrillin conserved domain-containing protein [Artemisia annua]|uniref:Plastid lipid-associated protein/fibrillin conserved domain-containing protein n=1 Tax=Artemisia annua TaxID=35608 RepID=A0A2U1N310_ARTAN|nr:Plastid lipid-associated protein/fibrillin conserved domain-containing protein [Artemisia annua]